MPRPGYDALRDEALALFTELVATADRAGADEAEQRLVAARRRLSEGRLTAVVCGEFKRGKSSLLNALLEEPGLFPVDDYYATSLVTTVEYGPEEEITVLLARVPTDDGGSNKDGDADVGGDDDVDGGFEQRTVTRAELADYVTEAGNPGNGKGVQGVAIRIPNPRLASGLVLVDTPGVGGVHGAHTTATHAALPGAHAILFVVDVDPMSESELQFLRRAADAAKVTEERDALFFALTKIDLVDDYDELLADTRRKLADSTGRTEQQVRLIPVSSHLKLDSVASGDPDELAMSNFGELEAVLWSALTRRQAKVLLSDALTTLDDSALALLRPIDAEIDALHTRQADATQTLDQVLDALESRLATLDAGDATWYDDLSGEVKELAGTVKSTTLKGVDAIWRRLETRYLSDDELLENTDRLVDRLVDDVSTEMANAKLHLDEGSAALLRAFARKSELDIGRSGIDALPDPPVPDLPDDSWPQSAQGHRPLLRTYNSSTKRATQTGIGIGMGLGRVVFPFLIPIPGIGALVGTGIGLAVGGLVGSAIDLRSALRAEQAKNQDARRRILTKELTPWYEKQRRHIERSIDAVAESFTHAIAAELRSRIVQARHSAEDAVRRARESSRSDVTQARAREPVLAAERAPIAALRDRVAELRQATVALTGGAP
ncbi:dynamin family protein [Streptacidiphilus sp. EB129]|uniref:dynamin family protein n=1 Tax=Streptacidiphilus sp. EB129 TaxID=3156262 RepID=UPI0035196F4E